MANALSLGFGDVAAAPANKRKGGRYPSKPLTFRDAAQAAAMSQLPVVSDVGGAVADAMMYIDEPESRTKLNYLLTGLGVLPGVPAMAGIFAGKGARTADAVLLAKAQEMSKSGASPFDVWQQTGWTDQFPDRKWRFEIDDSQMNWKPAFPEHQRGTVGDMIEHPPLFEAYPQLRGMDTDVTRADVRGGAFVPSQNKIEVTAPSRISAMSAYGHELQHPIQDVEGFARGGSPKMMTGIDPQPLMDRSDKLIRVVETQLPDVVARLKASGDIQGLLRLKRDPQTAEAYQAYIDLINEKGGKILSSAEVKQEADALWNLAESNTPMQQYKRLAGEAEARLVQQRMNYTPEMRRAVAPWQQMAADVPLDQQIVRFGDQGNALSLPDLQSQVDAMRAANRAKGLPIETGTGDLRGEIARRNAVNMLGLPETNTAADRAAAMGFDTGAYHGSNRDVYPGFDPAMLGENTEAASAKGAVFAATDKITPQSYVFGDYELGRDFFLGRPDIADDILSLRHEASKLKPGANQLLAALRGGVQKQTPEQISKLEKIKDRLIGEVGAAGIADRSINWTRETDLFDADVNVDKWIPISAVESPSPNILPLKVSTSGMLDHLQSTPAYREKTYEELIAQAEQANAPGVVIRNTQDGGPVTNILAIRDPSKIRSRFAAFDPARRGENDLLAGLLPYAIPAGLLGLMLTRPGEEYD